MARYLAIAGAAMVAVGMLASTPAQAAEAPSTPARACTETNGGTWVQLDGPRAIKGADGATLAEVFLMQQPGTTKKCVATIKRVDVGKETPVQASMQIEGFLPSDMVIPHERYATLVLDSRSHRVVYAGAIKFKQKEFAVEHEQWI